MEQRNNLVLQGTETFSRGQLDNVALDNGSVVLDSAIPNAQIRESPHCTIRFFCIFINVILS